MLSVHDKSDIVEFARALHDQGVRLLSTGGTAAALTDVGLPVRTISALTGQPEMLDGRVKTLHPRIFAGLLARRDDPRQMKELRQQEIEPIDLVAVNLYPFEATVADPGHCLQDALEQIDIGGVSLLRAGVKNAPHVVVVVDPHDYQQVLEAIEAGDLSLARRLQWARRAISHTSAYEAAISNYLNRVSISEANLEQTPVLEPFPRALTLSFQQLQSLRYGENPHQLAAFYGSTGSPPMGLAAARQLHGKELSYNNILDLDAAWRLARALPRPAAAIIKHSNPCGAASSPTLVEAYRRARATDPLSAFGSIVAFNQQVDEETAQEIITTFVEAVVAPGFTPAALEALRRKKSLRLLSLTPNADSGIAVRDYRSVEGGLLVQDRDPGGGCGDEQWRCVTDRSVDESEERSLRFAWMVVPHVRSNAIVVARGQQLIGVGAGQMSRVDACRFAVWKAHDAGHETAGCAAASDAFFPFADGVEALAEAGITAVVQPGGSIRDQEVIDAANRLGMAMVLTATRHFHH